MTHAVIIRHVCRLTLSQYKGTRNIVSITSNAFAPTLNPTLESPLKKIQLCMVVPTLQPLSHCQCHQIVSLEDSSSIIDRVVTGQGMYFSEKIPVILSYRHISIVWPRKWGKFFDKKILLFTLKKSLTGGHPN